MKGNSYIISSSYNPQPFGYRNKLTFDVEVVQMSPDQERKAWTNVPANLLISTIRANDAIEDMRE